MRDLFPDAFVSAASLNMQLSVSPVPQPSRYKHRKLQILSASPQGVPLANMSQWSTLYIICSTAQVRCLQQSWIARGNLLLTAVGTECRWALERPYVEERALASCNLES